MSSSSLFIKEDYDLAQIGYLENPFTCLLSKDINKNSPTGVSKWNK